MIRRSSIILAMLIAVAIAITVAGCGDKKSSSTSSMSAPEIIAAAKTADVTTKSAVIDATVTMTIKGDAAKLGQSDPQTEALLNSPITVSIKGAYQKEPLVFDGTVSATLMGQDVTFGLKTDGTDAWISYKDKWYETPADFKTSLADAKTQMSALSPDALMTQLDPTKMGATFTVVGTEQIGGLDAVHVSTTYAGPQVLQYLGEQMTTPGALQDSITGALGAASAAEPSAVPSVDPTQLAAVKDLMAAMTISTLKSDNWYLTGDHRTVKSEVTLAMTFGATIATMGLEGMDMNSSVTMTNLDQPVTVTAPDPVLPASQFDKDTAELQNMFPSGTGL